MADSAQNINLLPDDKQRLLRVQRVNALVVAASVIVVVVSVAVIILLTTAIGATQFALDQKKKEIANVNTQIATIDKLDGGTSLEDRAVTLQNQLAQLKNAYDQKSKKQFAMSVQRIAQIVPPAVNFTSASIDASRTVTISGTARTYNDVARFAQALKDDGSLINIPSISSTATGNETSGLLGSTNFFTNVELSSVSASGTGGTFSYSITYTLGDTADNV